MMRIFAPFICFHMENKLLARYKFDKYAVCQYCTNFLPQNKFEEVVGWRLAVS